MANSVGMDLDVVWTVNQAVQTVSMRKNGSRKFGASSLTQCDVANVGRVSIQKRTMEISVIVTDSSATTKPALEVSGYSNNFQSRQRVALVGRQTSSVV